MLNLKEENKELCFADSTQKPLKLYMYSWVDDELGGHWRFYTIVENSIMLESAENTEGILEGNAFTLGSFVIPQINVEWRNEGIKYNECLCVPVQQIGDEYIAYFAGEISQETISKDGLVVSAIIKPKINLKQDLKGFLADSWYDKLGEIISETLGSAKLFIDKSKLFSGFPNAHIKFNEFATENLPEKVDLESFLKACGDFLGAHIKFNTKQIVTEEQLNNGEIAHTFPVVEFVRVPKITSEIIPSVIKDTRYKQTEYIQGVGEQYINTDFYPNQDTRVVIDFELDQIDGNFLLGTRKSKFENAYVISMSDNQNIYSFYGSNGTAIGEIDTKRHVLDKNKNEVYLDEQLISSQNYENFQCEFPLEIFSCYNGTNGSGYLPCRAKVYSVKIYDNDVLVRDFVPSIDTTNGDTGLYDLVGGDFYISSSLSDFIVPSSSEKYTLPYYITANYDKNSIINYNTISLTSNDGDTEKIYTETIKKVEDAVVNAYEIENNFLYNAIEESERLYALRNVGNYVCNLNYYNCELQYTYAPFIEPNDVIVLKNIRFPGYVPLPNEYISLQYIQIENKINIGISPDGYDFEIDAKFELLNDDYCNIFATEDMSGGVKPTLKFFGDRTLAFEMYKGDELFEIGQVPLKEPIRLGISIQEGKISYSGTYNGEVEYNGDYPSATGQLFVGDDYNTFKLYNITYYENGKILANLYPCIREADETVGLYDVASGRFYETQTSANLVSETVVLPVLNSSAKGIHSMRADILINSSNIDI